jgi:digeranylgeranylglycerophospholipid reductase
MTGGGIVQAMIAAKYCGETAVKALKANNFSKKFLKEYADLWDDHLGKNQRFLYKLKNKFMGINDDNFNKLVAVCKRIPRDELNLQRLFKETIKEDPILLAQLATDFIISKVIK